MTRREWRVVIAKAIAFVCSLCATAACGGAESRWASANSGDWSDPAAWSNGVPGSGIDAVIDAAGPAYTVMVYISNAKADSLLLDSSAATLRLESGTLELGTLRLNRGTVGTSGLPTIRGATIYASPDAVFGGGVALDRVVFATDVTFTGGGTSFPSGLDLNGKTLTFRHTDGATYAYAFGPNTSITGSGQIVSDSQRGYESMSLYAPNSTLTIGSNVLIRTGTGNVDFGGAAAWAATPSVINNGQILAANSKQLGLRNVRNDGLIRVDGAKMDGCEVENHTGTIVIGAGSEATVENLVNDGTVRVDGGHLTLWGADNRGEISVTGGALSVGPGVYYFRAMQFTNTGTIRLQDSTLELHIPMASDEVDVRFMRTGTRALTVDKQLDNTGRTIAVSPTNRLYVTAGGSIVGGTISGPAGGFVAQGSDVAWGTLDGVTLGTDWLVEGGAPKIVHGLTLANGATIRLGLMSKEYTGMGFGGAQELAGNGRIVFDLLEQRTVVFTDDFTIGPNVAIETGAGDGIIGRRWNDAETQIRLVNRGLLRAGAGRSMEVNVKVLENHGTLELGDGGTVNVQGDLTFGSDGELLIALGSKRPVPLSVTGGLALDGNLTLELANGFMPALGQRFSIFACEGTTVGSFAAINLPALGEGLSWDTSGVNRGLLVVVPEPAALSSLCLIMLIAASRSRRER